MSGGGVDLVFLGIIEVGNIEARLLFANRHQRQCAGLDVSVEGPEVVLQPRDERHMDDRASRRQRGEKRPDGAGVHPDIFFFAALPGPGRQIHVGRFQPGDGLLDALGIRQVGGDVGNAVHQAIGLSRKPVNAGSAIKQFLGHAASRDTRRSHYQGHNMHDLLRPMPAIRPIRRALRAAADRASSRMNF